MNHNIKDNNPPFNEQLEDLILNRLPKAAADRLIEQIKNNPDLERQYLLQSLATHAVENDIANDVKSLLSDITLKPPILEAAPAATTPAATPPQTSILRRLLIPLSIAASLALVCLVGYHFYHTPTPLHTSEPVAAILSEVPTMDVLNLNGDNQQQILERAQAAFNQKDFDKAIEAFNQYLRNAPDDFEILTFKAIALRHDKKESQAIELLQYIITHKTKHLYGEQAEWELALAHLQNKQDHDATVLLQQISTTHEHEFAERAKTLLKMLGS